MQLTLFGPIIRRDQYSLLGRLVGQYYPDIAGKLMTRFNQAKPAPLLTDLALIDGLFLQFCTIRVIDAEEYRGNLHSPKLVDVRRVFIGAMVRLYAPHVYILEDNSYTLQYGLVQKLAKVLDQKAANISVMIRGVKRWEKVYEDFAAQVQEIVTQLNLQEVSNGSA